MEDALFADFFQLKSQDHPTESAPYELAHRIANGHLTREECREILARYGFDGEPRLLAVLLDWLLECVQLALTRRTDSEDALASVRMLKRTFGIKEGDFLKWRAAEVKEILCEQLEVILSDGILDDHEELAQSALQQVFDLGYDQYLALTRPLYERALEDLRAAIESAPMASIPALERRVLSLRAVCELAVVQPRSPGSLS